MKRPSELKRMSDRALNKLKLDLEDEVAALTAALALAKREQRARRTRKTARKRCGRRLPVQQLPPHVTLQ